MVDLSKLTNAERVIVASAVALFLVSFLPWFGLGDGSHSGWDNLLSALAILVGLAMLAQVVLARFTSVELPAPPLPWGQLHMILGIVAFALVLLQLMAGDRLEVRAAGIEFSVRLGRRVGLVLGLLAAGGLATGGVLRRQEEHDGLA